MMKIALATDHGGFEQLKELKIYLESNGYECQDFGPKTLDPNDDYPDFIIPAANAVASGECQMGIVLGRSGQGEAMAANRVKGVRAAVYYGPAKPIGAIDASGETSQDPYTVIKQSRQHNDSNVLSLGAAYLSADYMKQAVKVWLETPFSKEPRHIRRHQKMDVA